ncbi:hypothetical protein PRZ48_001358 [Zasmidium cellare]|uniref:Uncharacterized protein n=1 Tax=Zasmidium cellare TaxID=395010 RepID=A0ABR0F3F8_ZASCE|nr:hypothetical protein PRZ48_001358 [Zasmidium cellare]
MQSATRLDIVAIMLDGKKPAIKAPKAGAKEDGLGLGLASESTAAMDLHQRRVKERAAMFGEVRVVARNDRSVKSQKEPPPPPPRKQQQPTFQYTRAMQPASANTASKASSPRSPLPKPRPASLTLRSTNGYTALRSPELKQRICDARADESPTVTQVPIDQREALPPTPTTPFTVTMGNKPSSLSGSPVPDDKSVHRDSRRPVSRKSSFNIFKRVDSKSPLPRDITASVMSMLHRDAHEKSDSCATDDDGLISVPTDPFFDQPEVYDGRYPEMGPKIHSASTMTMTEEKAGMPLSASTTIRDYRSSEQSPVLSTTDASARDLKDLPPLPPPENDMRSPASPTLPAPSPLPEDSPHKYGLRDKIDTPEVPEQPEKINVAKMRRKSSGVEIFNEAKSLQSAQSFLNGLSTSRRRAESANDMRKTDNSDSAWTTVTSATSRPTSTRPSSTKPQSTYRESEGRRRGHNFKSSGFAYTRPLTLAQIKCYRGHNRLLPSRNKNAPVECAVCHIDDDADHFSCSWCALRMCKYCRKDFAERGLGALRERIRKAELGGAGDSANSSVESLQALRKSKSTSFA